jgi:hypothetical protein
MMSSLGITLRGKPVERNKDAGDGRDSLGFNGVLIILEL